MPAQQTAFIKQIEEFGPRVLIFDTLTRCFKFDTNDPDAWLVVNDFLLELRFRGYCVGFLFIMPERTEPSAAAGRTETTI